MSSMKLQIPCSYQGGKQSIAKDIVSIILEENKWDKNTIFYDMCCGSGAISIEMINRGIETKNIKMVDESPWGLFWKSIGEGRFSLDRFKEICAGIPEKTGEIPLFIESLSKQNANIDTVYIFLLLQSSSFGGKQIFIEGDKWIHHGFRTYWMPTETSIRRSPSNPMSPMPKSMMSRLELVVSKMKGIDAYQCDVNDFTNIKDTDIVYIDPPYVGTTGYNYSLDLLNYVESIKMKCYVSEGKKLSSVAHKIGKNRKNSSITGKRKEAKNEEWLNVFNCSLEQSYNIDII